MLQLAIIVPTFKERDNVRPLLACLDRVLQGVHFEIIFVDDDSPDGTASLIRQVALERADVRVLQRIGRRGLASACIEGMMATPAPYIAVMDADLQHDESILPEMLNVIRESGADLVLASRNMNGGSMGDFAKSRVAVSDLGRTIARLICKTEVTDPMSGFFLLDRRFLEEVAPHLSAIGFKILLDLLASADRPVKIREVPYRFRQRQHGESKLDMLVLVEYLQLVADKLIGNLVPSRFVLFSAVGTVGAVLYLVVLYVLFQSLRFDFRMSLVAGTVVAMTANFLLNNVITYRDRRLKGTALITGLFTFYLACSMGAFVSIRVSEMTRQTGAHWFLAGAAGIAIASVWNFTMTQFFTWRISRRGRQQNKGQGSSMTLAEFVYTVVLKPKPLRALANAVICKLIPAQVKVEGATIVLNPRDPVVSGALTFGQYEKPETKFFCAVCKPGMTFLDVGANIGYYTALASGRIGDGKIVAFEPDPENFTFLELTAAANHSRDLICLQKAVGAEKGTATLYASTNNRGDNRLYPNDLSDTSVQVEVNTIDAMLGDLGVQAVDLIKIDIQGFEGQAMRGMEETIRNSDSLTILMEFWPFGLQSAGTDPEKFLASLEQLDLRLYELTEKAVLVPLRDKANLISRYQGRRYTNIVALRGDAQVPAGFQA